MGQKRLRTTDLNVCIWTTMATQCSLCLASCTQNERSGYWGRKWRPHLSL